MSIAKDKAKKQNGNARRIKFSNLIAIVVCAVCVSGIIISFEQIRINNSVIDAARDYYASLAKEVHVENTPDLSKVMQINDKATSWITSLDGLIDYPVIDADYYGDYLNILPDSSANACGSLFLDVQSKSDFSGRLNIVYGKIIKEDLMLGSITGYKKQSYFDENPSMLFFTDFGRYRIELIYGCEITGEEWRNRGFSYEHNIDVLLGYASSNSMFVSDKEYGEDEKIFVLSQVDNDFMGKRFFLVGIMTELN